MVGRFNEEIAESMRHHLYGERRAIRILALGNRLGNHLAAEGIDADATIELPGSAQGIVARVEEILLWLESSLAGVVESQVLLAHHRPRRGGVYESTTRMLLPLDDAWLEELGTAPWPYRGIPAYSLPDRQLARCLIRQYLLVSLQRAMAQSLAAEQAKRLAAMHAAENNVLERIDSLNARYRRLRQATITSELLEVTAGFMVLESDAGRGKSR
jgi:F-type H+-transporting ATPase subunit gamma